MKVLKGDNVKIISGKDKGKTGEVLSVFKEKNRVLVKGVSIVKKHQKSKGEGVPSAIIEKEMPIHISNVQVIDPKSGKPSRVAYEVKDGKKTRVFVRKVKTKTATKAKTATKVKKKD